MPVPNARFTELLADIEPSMTTAGRASKGHNEVREHLRTQASFKNRYEISFLSGSYARDTAIRPRSTAEGTERPDVDIIVVTNFTETDTPENALREVARALYDGGRGYTVERVNKRSVRIEPWQAEMDIVPVIRTWGGYKIADRESGTWQFTNPPVHTQWSIDQSTRFGGRFKPLVKLLKWWRRQNISTKRPKGFALEALVAAHAPTSVAHYGEAFAQMLESIYANHGFGATMNQKPIIQDPAVPANDILRKVSITDWKAFIEKVRIHAALARRAQNAGTMEEATELWRRVLGNRFKATASLPKAASLSAFATAPSPARGYVFPDQMAAPANKPRGFA